MKTWKLSIAYLIDSWYGNAVFRKLLVLGILYFIEVVYEDVPVNKSTSNRSETTIKIFVMGPNCEINIPIMQAQFHVSNNSSQVKTSIGSNFMRFNNNIRDIKRLAIWVLSAW